MWLLTRLLDFLLPPRDTAQLVRDVHEDAFLALLDPHTLPDGTVVLLPYRNRFVRAAIIETKFKRNPKAIALLASVLREYCVANAEDSELSEKKPVFVPVPLSRERLHERGYNQVEEVLKAAHITYEPVLLRTRDTTPQTTLSGQKRHENMKGAFVFDGIPQPATSYIVLDDVTTTGATLHAARAALPDRAVQVLALAH